jgi:ATP-dependent Lon protease
MKNKKKNYIKLDFLTLEEKKYLLKLNKLEQKNIIKQFNKLNILKEDDIPFRFKLLNLDITNNNKIILLKLFDNFENLDNTTQEYFKYKIFFDIITNIPFNIYLNLNIDKNDINNYLLRAKNILNDNIYSHNKTKNYIIQMLGQYITNPHCIGNIIGLCGPPGTGKTTFVKNIGSILQKPIEIINLAGAQDVSYLEGHSFTYEGAKYGKILNTLIKHKCMNPIIFFDEVDKISSTDKGFELENLLINIVDITQNYNFTDKYFQELTFDLSQILFIFSYNNEDNINPILKDRIYEIKVNSYNTYDKLILCINYIIPDILCNYSFNKNDLIFNESSIKYLINTFCKTDLGIRNLKKILNNIISKIHIIYISNNNLIIDINNNIKFPITLNKNNIKQFL